MCGNTNDKIPNEKNTGVKKEKEMRRTETTRHIQARIRLEITNFKSERSVDLDGVLKTKTKMIQKLKICMKKRRQVKKVLQEIVFENVLQMTEQM